MIASQLNKIYACPQFEDVTQNNYCAVCNQILWIGMIISAAMMAYYIQTGNLRLIIGTGAGLMTSILCKILINFGKMRIAFALILIVGFGVTAIQSTLGLGLNDIGIQIFTPMLLISAIYFRSRGFYIIGAVTIIWFAAVYYLEIQGFYTNRPDPNTPTMKLFYTIGTTFFTLAVLQFSVRQLIESNENLNRLKQEAEAANVLKSRFLANMSHELRTPLNAIIGYGEDIVEGAALDEGEIDDHYLENINYILYSGGNLLSMINEILDLSKIEAREVETALEPISIEKLVEELLITITPLATSHNNQLTVSIEIEQDEFISDRMQLSRILLNLLSNACKFTKNGLISLEISNANWGNQQALAFGVSDTGVGIPQEAIDSIFNTFHQVDNSISRIHQGSGLGLAISKQLAALLGGEITVSSELFVGSKFILYLPKKTNMSP